MKPETVPKELFEELLEYCGTLQDDLAHAQEDLYVLREFLAYFQLEFLYGYFKERAHKVCSEDLPFPSLRL